MALFFFSRNNAEICSAAAWTKKNLFSLTNAESETKLSTQSILFCFLYFFWSWFFFSLLLCQGFLQFYCTNRYEEILMSSSALAGNSFFSLSLFFVSISSGHFVTCSKPVARDFYVPKTKYLLDANSLKSLDELLHLFPSFICQTRVGQAETKKNWQTAKCWVEYSPKSAWSG